MKTFVVLAVFSFVLATGFRLPLRRFEYETPRRAEPRKYEPIPRKTERKFYTEDVEDRLDYDEVGGEGDEDDYESEINEREDEEENMYDPSLRDRRSADPQTRPSGDEMY